MTKQEYEAAIQSLDMDLYASWLPDEGEKIAGKRHELKEQYISSLEAENAALTLLHTQATDEMLKMQNRVHELEAENSALKASSIVWHKYSDEKPDFDNDNAFYPLLAYICNGKQRAVEMVLYHNGTWYRADMGWYQDDQILYWSEMPAPPKGEK